MSLLDRLSGTEEPKLFVHQFWAAMSEYAESVITEQELMSAFNISSPTDLTEWTWLKNKYLSSTEKEGFLIKVHTLFMLAERNYFNYANKSVMQARINSLN